MKEKSKIKLNARITIGIAIFILAVIGANFSLSFLIPNGIPIDPDYLKLFRWDTQFHWLLSMIIGFIGIIGWYLISAYTTDLTEYVYMKSWKNLKIRKYFMNAKKMMKMEIILSVLLLVLLFVGLLWGLNFSLELEKNKMVSGPVYQFDIISDASLTTRINITKIGYEVAITNLNCLELHKISINSQLNMTECKVFYKNGSTELCSKELTSEGTFEMFCYNYIKELHLLFRSDKPPGGIYLIGKNTSVAGPNQFYVTFFFENNILHDYGIEYNENFPNFKPSLNIQPDYISFNWNKRQSDQINFNIVMENTEIAWQSRVILTITVSVTMAFLFKVRNVSRWLLEMIK